MSQEYKKDFDGWNKVKKETHSSKRAPVKLGEVYWCKLGLNIGVEQDGKESSFQRPVIIIKKFSNQIVLIAPLTTQVHKGDWYFDMVLFERKQQVILNQIRPIDTKRLTESMGQILKKDVEDILERYVQLIKT
jgi:mRNA interferase MazF